MSFSFLLTEPIVFENFYPKETSGDSNGQAHFAGGEDTMRWGDTNQLGGGGSQVEIGLLNPDRV